nr:Serine endoprotease DegS precursor [Klebsiella pneumoniae]
MLKINATGGLPVIPINLKRTPHIGDVVLAIGNPYNLGQTITGDYQRHRAHWPQSDRPPELPAD